MESSNITSANGFTLVKGGQIVASAPQISGDHDILIKDGVVDAVDTPGSFDSFVSQNQGACNVVDAKGLTVMPGLIDIHVHLREPGEEWKETVASGALAAVSGGVTAVCCMPNTRPANDSAEVTRYILERAKEADLCRVYPIGAITVGREGSNLAPMSELADAGCVAFSDDGWPVSSAGMMRRALEYSKMLGKPLTVHEEELSLSQGFSVNEGALSVRLGLKGMPGAAEDIMIARDIELARLTGGRVHLCHVSTKRAVTLIRRAKEDGIPVTAEVTPHHLLLDESCVGDFDSSYKMSMPLRTCEDIEALQAGLAEGVIDCIASDHAPHDDDSKSKEFDQAAFGILGLQTILPLTLRLVNSGLLKLEQAVSVLSSKPAACLGLPVNSFRKGDPGDLTIVDLQKQSVLKKEDILSKSTNSPFIGESMQGHVAYTIVAGRVVYQGVISGDSKR